MIMVENENLLNRPYLPMRAQHFKNSHPSITFRIEHLNISLREPCWVIHIILNITHCTRTSIITHERHLFALISLCHKGLTYDKV